MREDITIYTVIEMRNQKDVYGLIKTVLEEEISYTIKKKALHALGHISDITSVNFLTTSLMNEDSYIRCTAAHALRHIKKTFADNAVPALVLALSDEDIKDVVIKTLGILGTREVIYLLLSVIAHESNVELLEVAVEAFGNLRGKKVRTSAVSNLCYYVENEENSNRKYAVWALGELRDPAALPVLLECYQNGSKDIRYEAVYALSQMDDGRAVGPVLRATEDPDEEVSEWAHEVLGSVFNMMCSGYFDSKLLPSDLEGENEALRLSAVLHLGIKGDLKAFDSLLCYMRHDPNPCVRELTEICMWVGLIERDKGFLQEIE